MLDVYALVRVLCNRIQLSSESDMCIHTSIHEVARARVLIWRKALERLLLPANWQFCNIVIAIVDKRETKKLISI